MLAVDWSVLVRTLLFLLFAALTAFVAAVIGPTYDQILVPELSAGALFPSLTAAHPSGTNFLAPAARFSGYLVSGIVDPLVALVALGVAGLYLLRALSDRYRVEFGQLLPRLVIAVVAANFTVPIGGAILAVAGSAYPVFSAWDGGAWQHWVNLAGYGEFQLSWDNGALAFVLSMVEFALVLALVLLVGARDALLAVLVVLLPVFSLLWPFRPLSTLARRGWLLFVELAFFPCALVVPLELAVHAPSAVMLVGYLGAAVASPYLVSIAGAHLMGLGFPAAGNLIQQSGQRAIATAPAAPTAYVASAVAVGAGSAGRASAAGLRSVGSAAAPMAPPLAFAHLLGHGGAHLARHVGRAVRGSGSGPGRVPPLRPRGRA